MKDPIIVFEYVNSIKSTIFSGVDQLSQIERNMDYIISILAPPLLSAPKEKEPNPFQIDISKRY